MFIRQTFIICICTITFLCQVAAQHVSMETLTSYPFPSVLTSSSKGSKVALAINEQGKRNIYVAEGPSFSLRKLTTYAADNGEEITSICIASDGKRVVYVKGGDHGAFDESEARNPASMPTEAKVQVWSIPFEGGQPTCLSDGDSPVISPDGKMVVFQKRGQLWIVPSDGSEVAKPLFFEKGKSGSPQWSPDGTKIAFVSYRKDHALIGVYQNMQTPIRWVAPDFAWDESPRWSPDGQSIAFIRTSVRGGAPDSLTAPSPDPWAIWKADLVTNEVSRLWSSPPTLTGSIPTTHGGFNLHWAANKHITFLSYQDGWPHLYSVSEEGGEAQLLTPGNFMVEHVQLSPDGKWLLFAANTGIDGDDIDRRHLYRVPVNQPAMEALTAGKNIEAYPVITDEGRQVVYIQSAAKQPPLLALTTFKPNGPIRLLSEQLVPPALAKAKLIESSRVTFQAADGKTVYAQLFEPENSEKQHPAIVFIHGGPQRQMLMGWHYGDYYANTYALNQYLVSKGFVVLSVNYRLGIGYGYDFHKPAGAGRFGASEYQDIRAAGEWLAKQANIDVKRIGVYGGSYGGFLTALALGRNADLFAAGVDIHGVHNYMGRVSAQVAEPAPDVDLANQLAKESSPVSWVDGWISPALIIHGDDDGNVDFHQSVDLIERLKKKNAPIETLMIPDETHHWMRYHNQVKVNQAVADFFEKHFLHNK